MRYSWAGRTDPGRIRDHNEDAVFPEGDGQASDRFVVAVADGMGGHVGGEIASRAALDAAIDAEGDPEARVLAANGAVLDRVAEQPALAGMGTTLTMADIAESGRVELGHVGDSRAYLLRNGELRQITRDHSVVAELVESGDLRPEDVPFHPYRSVITRALGLERIVAVDTHDLRLAKDDVLLLCSDGLNTMISNDEIQTILEQAEDPAAAADALVDAANEAGGHDNITVIVVHTHADDAD
ncbi:MAG TPA: Stp1/IreP family PP2C-type Ser/Thr phosphatase [Acidimicrobiia bacterium]|nr:Stp1/IreP family PP2C-type Ser/Thr phosphatase [Acidimicrobiia bacterium]